MGAALADAALRLGHDVVVVSGPVSIDYPRGVELVQVTTTDEMLDACRRLFPECDGAIGAAAPCDYMPHFVQTQKIAKTGEPIALELIETPDVVAMMGQNKRADQWVVGFALETADRRFRATVKLQKKHCDLIVSNGPQAIDSSDNEVELLSPDGTVVIAVRGDKQYVADELLQHIEKRLVLHQPKQNSAKDT
ncbi:Coenzyme A biosynthesis bifunctional protein CoaBC [Stieleria varia]|uniref:Coenzyme A biosynthesis bifunctional protein CoaBC n=2 Tax=Stieleria varia TaxID=2528005 RepID=A0A5C6A1W4_9BACT|nr:Coenzyme A biosynthesis bifunctional protein CoaBC [Stieleria varia]